MNSGHQRLSGRNAFRSVARLTGQLPIAGTNECRFVRWMQSERETDEKERSFEGTRCLTICEQQATVCFHRFWAGVPRDAAEPASAPDRGYDLPWKSARRRPRQSRGVNCSV